MSKKISTHNIEGKKVVFKKEGDKLFMSMNRKMASFFEFHTQVYMDTDSRLTTDINNVFIHLDAEFNLSKIDWKTVDLKLKK